VRLLIHTKFTLCSFGSMTFFSDHSIARRGAYRELFEFLTAFLVEKWGKGGRRQLSLQIKEQVIVFCYKSAQARRALPKVHNDKKTYSTVQDFSGIRYTVIKIHSDKSK
jgi:hypothetical protein